MKNTKNSKSSKPVFVYSRISALKTRSSDASLEAQIALGEAFAARNGYPVAGTFKEVKSGGRMDNRPEWKKCLSEAKKAKGIIWIYSISRASRSVIDFMSLISTLEASEASIMSHSEDLRSDTASSKLMVGILAQFAEFEKNLAGERTKAALQNLKANGKKYSRKIPFGKKENSKGEFLNNPKEEKVISRMENLRLEGFTYEEVAGILNDENIPTREGKKWSKSVVFKILRRVRLDAKNEARQASAVMAK